MPSEKPVSAVTERFHAGLTGLRISKNLRGTTWRFQDSGTALEADSCLYAGERALAWKKAKRQGPFHAREFLAETPPDLVIEVEHTHADASRARRWAELGTGEIRRLDASDLNMDMNASMIGLQCAPRPAEIVQSRLFPGLSFRDLAHAVDIADRELHEDMRNFLETILDIRPDGPDSALPDP